MSDDDQRITCSRAGILLILSAPSGAGKTTLAHALLDAVGNLAWSVSYTTRPRRVGEVEGRDYHFVSEAVFLSLQSQNAFAEWARVHDAYYGTARAMVEDSLTCGQDLLLDIDVQGAAQLKTAYPDAVRVFVLPPSWHELERRLRGRGSEGKMTLDRRIQRARHEADHVEGYDYCVINDTVESGVATLQAILAAERQRVSRLRISLAKPESLSTESAEAVRPETGA